MRGGKKKKVIELLVQGRFEEEHIDQSIEITQQAMAELGKIDEIYFCMRKRRAPVNFAPRKIGHQIQSMLDGICWLLKSGVTEVPADSLKKGKDAPPGQQALL
jgi:hypothetical protein